MSERPSEFNLRLARQQSDADDAVIDAIRSAAFAEENVVRLEKRPGIQAGDYRVVTMNEGDDLFSCTLYGPVVDDDDD